MNVAAVATTVPSHDSIQSSTSFCESLTNVPTLSHPRNTDLNSSNYCTSDVLSSEPNRHLHQLSSLPKTNLVETPISDCEDSTPKENGPLQNNVELRTKGPTPPNGTPEKIDNNMVSRNLEKLLSDVTFSSTKDKSSDCPVLISSNGYGELSKPVASSPYKTASQPTQNGMYCGNVHDTIPMISSNGLSMASSSVFTNMPSTISFHPSATSRTAINPTFSQQQQPLLSVSSMPSSSAISYMSSVGPINHQAYAPSPILLTSLPGSANTRCFTVLRPTFLVGGPAPSPAPGGYFIATAPGQMNPPAGYTVVAQPHKNGLTPQACATYGVNNPTPCLNGYPILVNRPPSIASVVLSPEKSSIPSGNPLKILLPTSTKPSKSKKKELTTTPSVAMESNEDHTIPSTKPPPKKPRKRSAPSCPSHSSSTAKTMSNAVGKSTNQDFSATDVLSMLKSRFASTFIAKPQLPPFRPFISSYSPIVEHVLYSNAESEQLSFQSIPRRCPHKYSVLNRLLRQVGKDSNGPHNTDDDNEPVNGSINVKKEAVENDETGNVPTFRRPFSCRPVSQLRVADAEVAISFKNLLQNKEEHGNKLLHPLQYCRNCGNEITEDKDLFPIIENVPLKTRLGAEVMVAEHSSLCKQASCQMKKPTADTDPPMQTNLQFAFCNEECHRTFLQQLDRIHSRTLVNSTYLSNNEEGDARYNETELQSILTGTKINCFVHFTCSKVAPSHLQHLPLFVVHLGSVPRLLLQFGSTSSLLSFPWKRKHSSNASSGSTCIALKKRKLQHDQRIRWQNIYWKYFHPTDKNNKHPNSTDGSHATRSTFDNVSFEEVDLRLQSSAIVLKTSELADERICALCTRQGDFPESSAGRLLCFDINRWLHVNCVLWCLNVYETQGGALATVLPNFNQARKRKCSRCGQLGAGVPCYSQHCNIFYHLPCAREACCQFTSDRGMFCPRHLLSEKELLPKSNVSFTLLEDLSVQRRVYIERPEKEQTAQVITEDKFQYIVRIGSWVLQSPGQLLPHHITSGSFHSRDYIYPVGYAVKRYYWSLFKPNSRAVYECSIAEEITESSTRPIFRVKVLFDPSFSEDASEVTQFEDHSPSLVWQKVLQKISLLRSAAGKIHLFSQHLIGEKLFGLCEPHIVRIVESLSGVEMLRDYAFKFGRMELISNMPLAVNPRGCARAEPKREKFVPKISISVNATSRVHHHNVTSIGLSQKSQFSQVDPTSNSSINTTTNQNLLSPNEFANFYGSEDYSSSTTNNKFQLHQANSNNNRHRQYRRLQREFADNVVLRRSGIQGLGLYAARNMEKSTMIIEYIGELIRNDVANRREKLYDLHNRGIYMFRINDDWIVDATMTGGLARYINHSCNPNCVAEILNLDSEQQHIVIMANRDISTGEELTYDYKFDIEDSSQGLPCLCGAPNCRKWMNG